MDDNKKGTEDCNKFVRITVDFPPVHPRRAKSPPHLLRFLFLISQNLVQVLYSKSHLIFKKVYERSIQISSS